MAMEITQVLQGTQSQPRQDMTRTLQKMRTEFVQQAEAQLEQREAKISREQVRQLTQELKDVTQAFNKRLSFSYNDELEQMVVKVIDRETDTVIKELPPSELQRVHLRIREAIGLLLDESV